MPFIGVWPKVGPKSEKSQDSTITCGKSSILATKTGSEYVILEL